MDYALEEIIRDHSNPSSIDSGAVVGRYVRGPIHTDLLRLLNRFIASTDPDERAELRSRIYRQFERFADSGGDGHPNGPFVLLAMEGGIAFAVEGNTARALELAECSLEASSTAWQRAIAFGNMSEACRHLGQFGRSVGFAAEAVRLDSRNEGFWIHLLLGLLAQARDQRLDEDARLDADRSVRETCRAVQQRIEQAADRVVWARYLESYTEFNDVGTRMEFPEISDLVRAATRA